ncbi:MAG: ATP synthase F1 subunit epsilon [Thermoleophilaceae bacterium]|nr:ATP synthase F1 subunit epsilon [Thermoleophilaceae bacterium]
MAFTTFPVEVQTPEGLVFEGEVELVSTRTVTGSIGIRANHSPIMTMLDPAELRLYRSPTDILRFAQGEGYLQMAKNHTLMLVEEAIPADQLDAVKLQEQLDEAQARLDAAAAGSADLERAQRDFKRATVFLAIASS